MDGQTEGKRERGKSGRKERENNEEKKIERQINWQKHRKKEQNNLMRKPLDVWKFWQSEKAPYDIEESIKYDLGERECETKRKRKDWR